MRNPRAGWAFSVPTGTLYEDLGGDYYTRLNPERARTRAIRQLENLGYTVTLDKAS